MTIHIRNPQTSALVRRYAKQEGLSITDAVARATKLALREQASRETASETAQRILRERGIVLSPAASKPLDRSVYDDLEGNI
jgi:antitoxin VapB